jgi:hypothetical protein
MKYMRWSYPQLMLCPEPYVEEIIAYADREAQAHEEAMQKH